MPVVVTGAAGFIGRMLTAVLATDGEHVVAVDRRPVPVLHPNVSALHADLLDGNAQVESALREADVVFHLAGRPGVRDRAPEADLHRHRDNVIATARVLALVPPHTPLVVASSSSVYGDSGGRPSTEESPLRPLGGYARSKVAMEMLCAQRIAAGGAVAVARIFTVVGEGQRPDMALARWIDAVRRGRPVQLYGSPWRRRDVTDVREVVRSLRAMAERGVVGALNVGTGAPRTLADLVAATCRAVGVPPDITVTPKCVEEPDSTCADTHRHERLLGFRPVTDLDAVVRRQLAACLAAEQAVDAEPVADAARPGGRQAVYAGLPAACAEEVEERPARQPTLVETAVVDSDLDEPDLPVAAPVAFLPRRQAAAADETPGSEPAPERLVPFRSAASVWNAEHADLLQISRPSSYGLPDNLADADLSVDRLVGCGQASGPGAPAETHPAADRPVGTVEDGEGEPATVTSGRRQDAAPPADAEVVPLPAGEGPDDDDDGPGPGDGGPAGQVGPADTAYAAS